MTDHLDDLSRARSIGPACVAWAEGVQHTPGPWHTCHDGKCSCFTVMSDHHPVAQVTNGAWGDDFPAIRLVGTSSLDFKAEAFMEQITYGEISEKTARANWRLIAAAPDMHDALVALVSAFQSYTQWSGEPIAEIVAARAAIAKARGENP